MTRYSGSCHCGKIRFTVEAEIDHVRVCDCSICSKRGALNFRVPKGNLTLESGWDSFTLYQWGSFTAQDYFCPTCGILAFRRPSDPTAKELRERTTEPFDGWAVNVRCLEGVDYESLPKTRIAGSTLDINEQTRN